MCKECVKGVGKLVKREDQSKFEGSIKGVSRVSVCFRVVSAVIDSDRYK